MTLSDLERRDRRCQFSEGSPHILFSQQQSCSKYYLIKYKYKRCTYKYQYMKSKYKYKYRRSKYQYKYKVQSLKTS